MAQSHICTRSDRSVYRLLKMFFGVILDTDPMLYTQRPLQGGFCGSMTKQTAHSGRFEVSGIPGSLLLKRLKGHFLHFFCYDQAVDVCHLARAVFVFDNEVHLFYLNGFAACGADTYTTGYAVHVAPPYHSRETSQKKPVVHHCGTPHYNSIHSSFCGMGLL